MSDVEVKDVIHETPTHWVKRTPKGFEVYKSGVTHSTRVAIFGRGDDYQRRAISDCNRRHEAASTTS